MKKQALTAAVLTAALTLGTVPAYAAATLGTVTDSTINGSSGSVNTTVKVETTVSQIKAALPLEMTVAAPTVGGSTSTPAAYKIINKSTFPVKITSATATAAEGWKLSATALQKDDAPKGAIGDLQMSLTPTGATAWQVAEKFAATNWKIAGAADGKDGELPIAIAATNSALKKTYTSATQAVSLSFTIAADSETVQSGSGTDPEPTPEPNPDPTPEPNPDQPQS